jgi:C-terminal processing protease CtpA/Prc
MRDTMAQEQQTNLANHNREQQQHLQQRPAPPINTEKDTERAIELLRKLKQHATHHSYRQDLAAMERLDLLSKALDSDLFKSVCQVYDQIYDTANITGSSELKAAASAKATVAVFSASIGHSHPRTVELPKTEEGLGFNVMSFDCSGVFISQITPGSVADKHGGLRRGDRLISIDGINVENADHTKAVELLKAAKGRVTLVLKYMPALLSQIEASYAIKQQQQQKQHH